MFNIGAPSIMAGDKEIPFDVRHRSIIDALPVWGDVKTTLDVGCGNATVSRRLEQMGYQVEALDLERKESWDYPAGVKFIEGDFMTTKELKTSYDVVMCSEVLEHLPNYKEFFDKLLSLTTKRLIITVPYERSFDQKGPPPKGHCNHWTFKSSKTSYTCISEFYKMAKPHSTSISKIVTKLKDTQTRQACILIVVDKRQYGD